MTLRAAFRFLALGGDLGCCGDGLARRVSGGCLPFGGGRDPLRAALGGAACRTKCSHARGQAAGWVGRWDGQWSDGP